MITICESDTAYPFNQPKNMTELSPNSLTILEKRYLKEDEEGNVAETPVQIGNDTEVMQMKRR